MAEPVAPAPTVCPECATPLSVARICPTIGYARVVVWCPVCTMNDGSRSDNEETK